MLWVLLASLYFTLGFGLYCKTYTFNRQVYNREYAFFAPLFWVLTIVYLLFFLSSNEKYNKRKILRVLLFHPYLSLLLVSFVLTSETDMNLARKEDCKRTCMKITYSCNNGFKKKGMHLAT